MFTDGNPRHPTRWKTKAVALVVVVAALVSGHVFLVGGAPFAAAEAFIRAHPTVKSELGGVESVGLSWFSSMEMSGPSGSAHLRCPVVGASARASVYVDLVRRAGVWEVESANLVRADESVVPLTPLR